MAKSLFDKGMTAVMDDVLKKVDSDPRVVLANKALKSLSDTLKLSLSKELCGLIEEAVNTVRAADAEAGFRIGVTEGLRLANSVRALIGPEGAEKK